MDDILDRKEGEQIEKFSYKFRVTALFLLCGLVVIGQIFKILHWPGGAVITVFSAATLTGYNFYSILHLKGKSFLNLTFSALGLLITIYVIWGAFFNNGQPFNTFGILVFSAIIGLEFIILHIAHIIRKRMFVSRDSKNQLT